MGHSQPSDPGSKRPQPKEWTEQQKPSIDVEREQAGVEEDRTKPAAPSETLLPPD